MPYQWVKRELDEDEISRLIEKVKSKIELGDAFQLLPYYGLLYFRDKIWEGKIYGLEEAKFDGNDKDTGTISIPRFILLKSCPKIISKFTSGECIKKCFTVFDSTGDDDIFKDEERKYSEMLECVVNGNNNMIKSNLRVCAWRSFLFRSLEKLFLEKGAIFPPKITACFAVLNTKSRKFQEASQTSEGYQIRKMTQDETLYAVKQWKFSSAAAVERFLNSSNLGLTFGAFPIGSETPVAWAMVSWNGAIAALQTLPEHRRKGLAKAVIKVISTEMIERDLIPFVFIEDVETSMIPMALFSSIGFTCYPDTKVCWTAVQGN